MEPKTPSLPSSIISTDRAADRIRAAVSLIEEDLGTEALVELLQTFLIDTPQRLVELQALAGGPDQSSLRRAAHSLKGSSALFGVDDLEACALELELSAEAGRIKIQVEQAQAIRKAFERTRPLLEALATKPGMVP